MTRHIHILGICGTFMGGIAALAKAAGFRVTGCDTNVYPPMSDQLRSLGIELLEGFSADQIHLKPDLWVIGNVVTRGNPLMEEILDRGLPFESGPHWLARRVLKGQWVLAVAGTHGKTSTSSMLAWILEAAGQAPGFLIGGVPANFGVTARPGAGRHFVIEADEYDTAYFDKRSKFVHYGARTAVINNIEFDHADIFQDLASIERQFHHFVRTVPRSGRIVANGADPVVERVLETGCWSPVERFGVATGWSASDADAEGSFEVRRQGRPVGRVDWDLTGDHNRLNALAAIAAACTTGVSAEVSVSSLHDFRGVKRRLERLGEVRGVTVFDDFAHHPTAIRTTLEGLRSKRRTGRLVAVLEPRSNTMKLGAMKDRLADSLACADRVFVYSKGIGWDPADALRALGGRASCHDDIVSMATDAAAAATEGDAIVVMSNGGFGGVHARILSALESSR